jgi:hypothetical protein
MVDALADLTLPELEHVAIFRGPFGGVSDSHMLDKPAGLAGQHLGDHGPGQGDQAQSRADHHLVGRRR